MIVEDSYQQDVRGCTCCTKIGGGGTIAYSACVDNRGSKKVLKEQYEICCQQL